MSFGLTYARHKAVKVVNRIDHMATGLSAAVMDALYQSDNDDLLLESVTLEDLDATLFYGIDAGPDLMMEAISAKKAQLAKTMAAFARALNMALNGRNMTASQDVEISKPRKSGAVAVMTAKIALSDGQSVSVVFHAPDKDPLVINSSDTLIAFRFVLNGRDITHVVAPSGGNEVSLKQVTVAIASLAERNSEKFQAKQAENAGYKQEIEQAAEQSEQLESDLAATSDKITQAESDIQAATSNAEKLQQRIDKQNELQAKLQAEIDGLKAQSQGVPESAPELDPESAEKTQKQQSIGYFDAAYADFKAIDAKLAADIRSSLITIGRIDNGVEPGYDRSLFVSSITGKIKRLAKNGDQDTVNAALKLISAFNEIVDKPAITDRNAVWKLASDEPEQQPEATPEPPAAEEPTSGGELYWYGLKARPAGMGATPNVQNQGILSNAEALDKFPDAGVKVRHGAIAYDRKLTDKEVYGFELQRLSANTQVKDEPEPEDEPEPATELTPEAENPELSPEPEKPVEDDPHANHPYKDDPDVAARIAEYRAQKGRLFKSGDSVTGKDLVRYRIQSVNPPFGADIRDEDGFTTNVNVDDLSYNGIHIEGLNEPEADMSELVELLADIPTPLDQFINEKGYMSFDGQDAIAEHFKAKGMNLTHAVKQAQRVKAAQSSGEIDLRGVEPEGAPAQGIQEIQNIVDDLNSGSISLKAAKERVHGLVAGKPKHIQNALNDAARPKRKAMFIAVLEEAMDRMRAHNPNAPRVNTGGLDTFDFNTETYNIIDEIGMFGKSWNEVGEKHPKKLFDMIEDDENLNDYQRSELLKAAKATYGDQTIGQPLQLTDEQAIERLTQLRHLGFDIDLVKGGQMVKFPPELNQEDLKYDFSDADVAADAINRIYNDYYHAAYDAPANIQDSIEAVKRRFAAGELNLTKAKYWFDPNGTGLYGKQSPEVKAALDKAIAAKRKDKFFAALDEALAIAQSQRGAEPDSDAPEQPGLTAEQQALIDQARELGAEIEVSDNEIFFTGEGLRSSVGADPSNADEVEYLVSKIQSWIDDEPERAEKRKLEADRELLAQFVKGARLPKGWKFDKSELDSERPTIDIETPLAKYSHNLSYMLSPSQTDRTQVNLLFNEGSELKENVQSVKEAVQVIKDLLLSGSPESLRDEIDEIEDFYNISPEGQALIDEYKQRHNIGAKSEPEQPTSELDAAVDALKALVDSTGLSSDEYLSRMENAFTTITEADKLAEYEPLMNEAADKLTVIMDAEEQGEAA